MLTITMTEEKADERIAVAAIAAAKILVEDGNLALEIASPPAVLETPEGVKVMCWMPITREEL